MSTIEEALRFFPKGTPQSKADREARLLVSRSGYYIQRVAIPNIATPRKNALPAFIRWDVFTPDGRWLGLEPSHWWAMKLADRHYFGVARAT